MLAAEEYSAFSDSFSGKSRYAKFASKKADFDLKSAGLFFDSKEEDEVIRLGSGKRDLFDDEFGRRMEKATGDGDEQRKPCTVVYTAPDWRLLCQAP